MNLWDIKKEGLSAESPSFLALIFKFKLIDADGIAVFDAHGFQTVKDTGFPQDTVEEHPTLIIAQVHTL